MIHTTRLFLLSMLLLTLTACSNETSESPDNEMSSDRYTETDQAGQSGYYDSSPGSDPFPENWRQGTLLMTLKISQHGDQEAETLAQGGTKTESKWDFLLNAKQERQVMLPPDFTKIMPDYDAALINPMILDELVFIPLVSSEPETEGEVSFNGQMEVRTPRANEIVLQTTRVAAHSKLDEFSLDAVRLSSIGKGFEADMRLAYKMTGNIRMTTHYKGGSIQTFDVECCELESEYPRFFPEPNLNIAKRVNYPADANIPQVIADTNRQLRLELVAALEKIVNNTEPRATLHPGMQWTIEPNLLKLRYHSETANLISQGNMLAMAAPASERLYTLEITLQADE